MGELTFTPSVPSATRSLPMRPSSTASNSIVALSVSISARMSPDLTASPSLTSHLESLPSSLVGDSAGIRISVDMSGRYVGVEFGKAGLGAFGGEFGRGGDRGLDLTVHGLEVLFIDDAALDQLLAEMLDRIALLAHFGDFLAGAVFGRIGHRVAAIAIGLHFQDDRAIALAAIIDGLGPGSRHRLDIHAVDLAARNIERDAALGEIGQGGGTRHTGAHGIL